MVLSDIAGVEDYLENRCFKPGEIYDYTGFFYHTFSPGDECTVVYEGKDIRKQNVNVVVAVCGDQLINFWRDTEDHVIQAERYDATTHNTEQMPLYLQGRVQELYLDKYNSTNYFNDIAKIKKIGGAVII